MPHTKELIEHPEGVTKALQALIMADSTKHKVNIRSSRVKLSDSPNARDIQFSSHNARYMGGRHDCAKCPAVVSFSCVERRPLH